MTTLHCYCQPKIDSIKSLWATFLIRIYLIIVIKKTLYSCCNCCCENCIVIVIVRTTLLLSAQDRLNQIPVANILLRRIYLIIVVMKTLYCYCYCCCENCIVFVIVRTILLLSSQDGLTQIHVANNVVKTLYCYFEGFKLLLLF